MELEKAIEIVRNRSSAKRFQHVLGVVDAAAMLADRFGCDREKAMLAAALHDIAKCETKERLHELMITAGLPQELLSYQVELWHAPVGAYITQAELSVIDPDILTAIRFHTTGRANMSLLEKVVFLADYIELGRTTPRVEECRQLAEANLDQAMIFAYQRTIEHLLQQQMAIHPDTILGYNDLVNTGVSE